MNTKQVFFGLLVCIAALTSCDTRKQVAVGNELSLTRAKQTLDSLYQNYSAPGTCLLRENYPSNVGDYTATLSGIRRTKELAQPILLLMALFRHLLRSKRFI